MEGNNSQTSVSSLDPFPELQTHAGAGREVPKLFTPISGTELSTNYSMATGLFHISERGTTVCSAPQPESRATTSLHSFLSLTSTSSKLATLKSPPKCHIRKKLYKIFFFFKLRKEFTYILVFLYKIPHIMGYSLNLF